MSSWLYSKVPCNLIRAFFVLLFQYTPKYEQIMMTHGNMIASL